MKVTNYTQFAKPALILGLSRPVLMILMGVGIVVFSFLMIFDINSLLIIWTVAVVIGYLRFIMLFRKDIHWFDRYAVRTDLERRYKFLKKYKTLIGRF